MSLLYAIGIRSYAFAAQIAGLFSAKAKARVQGANNSLASLQPTPTGQTCYWMHCASVGEFEQGRPLWDRLMENDPDARFVLSFFSPSGYDVFTDKPEVGEVVYLPWDVGNAPRTFVARLSPKLAIFVKYEWWLGFFEALDSLKVSTIVISAAFRQNQPFFKYHLLRRAYQKALFSVDQVFVQDEASVALLRRIGHSNHTLSGDTRIDRTLMNRAERLDHPVLEEWASAAAYLMVAGSTWLQDVELLSQTLLEHEELKLLIAPHEVGAKSIAGTHQVLAKAIPEEQIVLLSELQAERKPRVVVVDSIGLLSKLYRLGQVAYIGGGFGAGIHNTLEAVVYGIPIAFGPKHQKFQEASQLLDQKVARAVANLRELSTFVDDFSDPEARKLVLAKAEKYIEKNHGATLRIWNYLTDRKLI